jgi:exodeoxyribonuclease VII small subunit
MTEDLPITETDRPRLSTLFTRLDAILAQLDREDVDLEEQMALYREACGHLGSARAILDETQAEIEFLMAGDPPATPESG